MASTPPLSVSRAPPASQTDSSTATQYQPHQEGAAHNSVSSRPAQHGVMQPQDPSWITKLLACMWPQISAAAEKMAKDMLPDMLNSSKPTWMTSLALDTFELGDIPPKIEGVNVEPGGIPGADDVFLEFDFTWHGQQNISLSINPAPTFTQKIPLLGKLASKAMTWKVGVKDLVIIGRLRTTFVPLLPVMPVVGAVQAAFVGLPQLDFELTLPEGVHAVVPVQYLDSWLDSFIADNILSMYMLPDHFFNPVAEGVKDILTPEGILEVHLVEAINVPSMDLIGASDPFIKIWLRPSQPKETPQKSGSHPAWGPEEAQWGLPVHVRSHQVLTIALFDSDSVGSDEVGRTRINLGDLHPGHEEDLWLHITIPETAESAKKDKRRTRDKLAGVLFGSKGSKSSDVKGCQVHVKLTYHPMSDEAIRDINAAQAHGKTPHPEVIRDPVISELIQKYKLMDEMFPQEQSNNESKGQQ